ncbi:MAG: TonB-dependent receptor domain-containing protein [Gammaproteobacteria bacterium]
MALQGSQATDFNEDLMLAKIDAQLTGSQSVEFTARMRDESDFVPEDKLLSVEENTKDRTNDETRFDIKHEWRSDIWLNEARAGYQEATWNPHSNSSEALTKYFISPSNMANNVRSVIWTGGSPDAQFREQSGYYIQEDLTFSGRENHTFKGGIKVNFLSFDLSGTARSVPVTELLIDNVTGNTSVIRTDPVLIPAGASFDDEQFGIYLQDDWRITDRLELNLGLRWDYETNLLNDDYVTPAERVTALFALDGPRAGITPPPGQTYDQSLALGGVNISEYIADGSSRKAFKEAFQPRLGFSYDLSGNKNTVLFGGAGRAYDRTMANHALDELQKNLQPGGEIWLIKNDHELPYTDQFSLGVRQGFGPWNTEVGAIHGRGHNQFNWFHGNRDPNGGFGQQSPIDPLWGGPIGFGSLVLGDFVTETRTSSLYLQGEVPFSRSTGWGLIATYTYSDGETTHRNWNQDIFNWTHGKPGQEGFNPSVDVEEHRLVVAGLTNKLPWGIMLSGKGTLGSGLPYQLTDCSLGFNQCVYREGDGSTFKQLDIALSKDFELFAARFTVRADVLNALNYSNYGGYDGWVGGPGSFSPNEYGGDNPNTGTPNSIAGLMRTLKISFRASF